MLWKVALSVEIVMCYYRMIDRLIAVIHNHRGIDGLLVGMWDCGVNGRLIAVMRIHRMIGGLLVVKHNYGVIDALLVVMWDCGVIDALLVMMRDCRLISGLLVMMWDCGVIDIELSADLFYWHVVAR